MPFTHIPGVSIRYVPAGFSSVTYDGSTIPQDSILYFDDGLDNTLATLGTHTGGNGSDSLIDDQQAWELNEWIGYTVQQMIGNGETGAIIGNSATVITATLTGAASWDAGVSYRIQHATKLTDTTKTWTPGEWVNLKLVNSTDGSEGIITGNTENTITVSSLAGGEFNYVRMGHDYNIVIDIDINDKIEFESATHQGGTVSMSVTGVPTITGASGTHTFNARIVDVSPDPDETSAEFLVTVTV